METRVKGTMILRIEDWFSKVITVRGTGNRYVFECIDLDSKQKQIFTYEMLGVLEALDAATSVMKDPKDILFMDLDNQGEWKIATKKQINRVLKSH